MARMLNSDDLRSITGKTLEHYEQNAEGFWEATRDHDVAQNIEALLESIEGQPPFTILDFGCGPGRDLRRFCELGHVAVGLDGAACFVIRARGYSGCEVLEQDFLHLDLPAGRFDGIFANASLFHVPAQEMPRILRELLVTLKEGGVLFCSNPRGRNEEGWNGERYGVSFDWLTWSHLVHEAGFEPIRHYYRPEGKPREQQPWLASLWRKPHPSASDRAT